MSSPSFTRREVRRDPSPPPLLPSRDATQLRLRYSLRSSILYVVCITIFGRLRVEDGRLGDEIRGLADREAAIHRNGGDLWLRGLAAMDDGYSHAEEKSHAKRAKQKRSWTKIVGSTIFGKCQVKNAKHLEMDLFFPLAKCLETWQILTNGKFQLHNCWRCSKLCKPPIMV